ncbi:MAG: carboxy-S-adenosyl-L-methionine synthase CmoA [Nitrospirota bacterium]
MSSNNDTLFSKKIKKIDDFNFGKETASVFDNMLHRSVPFYDEVQRMICEIVSDFVVEGTNIYDLGCSTCTTLLNLDKVINHKIKFIGIDSSQDMLDKGKERLIRSNVSRNYELRCSDLNQGIHIINASVVIMNLTLQFIRPLYRTKVINSIYNGLNEQGCVIIFEKVIGENSLFNRLFIKYYYEMKKRNGYSDMEVSQKREALENVLIPYKLWENKELLSETGFRYFDIFFKWYNFCGIIGIK